MSANKIKILVVDDEEDFSFFLSKNLERLDCYKVVSAKNGKAGIKLAKSNKPDLIFLDIMMPGINGFEVLEELKKDKETLSIPVVMLTGKCEEENKEKAASLKSADYIVKPAGLDQIRSTIEEVLAKNPKK